MRENVPFMQRKSGLAGEQACLSSTDASRPMPSANAARIRARGWSMSDLAARALESTVSLGGCAAVVLCRPVADGLMDRQLRNPISSVLPVAQRVASAGEGEARAVKWGDETGGLYRSNCQADRMLQSLVVEGYQPSAVARLGSQQTAATGSGLSSRMKQRAPGFQQAAGSLEQATALARRNAHTASVAGAVAIAATRPVALGAQAMEWFATSSRRFDSVLCDT
jgi:methyl-accepting chemotaxis protein